MMSQAQDDPFDRYVFLPMGESRLYPSLRCPSDKPTDFFKLRLGLNGEDPMRYQKNTSRRFHLFELASRFEANL